MKNPRIPKRLQKKNEETLIRLLAKRNTLEMRITEGILLDE